ncbi:MAG: hypothetical protein WEF86_10985 [Gemmatimonadota bacterium]
MRTPRMLAAAAALIAGLAACDAMPAGPGLDDTDELAALLATGDIADAGSADGTGAAGGTAEVGDADAERRRTDGPGKERRGSIFDRLNEQIDGFAGIYRAGRCSVVLVLTEGANVQEAVRIVHAVIEPLVARTCPSGIRVTPERGQYTYDELHRYHGVALPLVRSRAVYAATVSYPLNAVLITVADRETARRVLEFLTDQGVPEGAVEFRGRRNTDSTDASR